MFLKKLIALNVIVLGLICVGCSSTNVDNQDLSTNNSNIKDSNLEESITKDKKEESKIEDKNSEKDNNNKEEETIVDKNNDKETVEVINEDTGEITKEEVVDITEITPDKDFFFYQLEELPKDIQEWVLANKDKKKEVSAYVKTTSDATYVLVSVENDTGSKVPRIYTPYVLSDSDEWVVPYSYGNRNRWIDSNGNEYLVMKTIKPVKVRLEHATIYED